MSNLRDKFKQSRDPRSQLIPGKKNTEPEISSDSKQEEKKTPKDKLMDTPITTAPAKEPQLTPEPRIPAEKPSGASLEPSTGSGGELEVQLQAEDEIAALQRKMGNENSDDFERGNQSNMSSSSSSSTAFPYDPFAETQPIPYKTKRFKKERLIDTHKSATYYIENEIIEIIEDIVGGDPGGKYRLVNESLKKLIFEEYPEHAHRIRKS